MPIGIPTAWWIHYLPDLMPIMLVVGPYLPIAWWVIWSGALATGNYFLARRLERRPWLWAILTFIPIVGTFFLLYVMYQVVYALLDRVEVLKLVREKSRS